MLKSFTLFNFLFLLLHQFSIAQEATTNLKGVVTVDGQPVPFANVSLEGTIFGASTDENGLFEIKKVNVGTYSLIISAVGFEKLSEPINISEGEMKPVSYALNYKLNHLQEVEVFGVRDKQPEKLDAITRLPLSPSSQIQSISVISEKLIEQQGALTISEVSRNVPGVYTYATYGNMRESMSSRGFRGIPVLKNGVRVHSDFRGQGFLTDMQGVESIQVLKGSNALSMGTASDLGSPGGVINIVTKTPKFENSGQVSLRAGSWGQVRPAFDVQGVLDQKNTVAFRLNGVYERMNSYRPGVGLEKIYINPSLEWRPDSKTVFNLEMDYMNDSRTPDAGTVNLSLTENQIYNVPFNRNLGWVDNRSLTENTTWSARIKRDISRDFYLRASYFKSALNTDAVVTSIAQFTKNGEFLRSSNIVRRSLGHYTRDDKNSVLQVDLVGQNVSTGTIKHTIQTGMDYRTSQVYMPTFGSIGVDTVDVFARVTNTLPADIGNFEQTGEAQSSERGFGLMAQDVIEVNRFLKAFLGIRYSSSQSTSPSATGVTRDEAWNPLGGIIVNPHKGLNLFASYTNSTSPRSATYQDVNGNALGNERIDQFEAGIKSDWINNRLRFNLTLYKINNKNMNIRAVEVDENGVVIQLPYYFKGGNDERKGIEVELAGRILENLEAVAGYAYIDARYKEHTTFVEGSMPNNTPRNTANIWLRYSLVEGPLKSLTFSAGAYYIGERPNNDWTQRGIDFHAITPGQAPWYMKAYTTVNAQISYNLTENFAARVLVNNLFDAEGYNAYRTAYINRINPRNFAAVLSYRFN